MHQKHPKKFGRIYVLLAAMFTELLSKNVNNGG
jgi:hypothetical protein